MVAIITRNPNQTLLMEYPDLIEEEFLPVVWDTGFRTDMFEVKDEFIVRAELPGVKREDIDISIEGDNLLIKAQKKMEEVPEDAVYYTCERWSGEYSRSMSLPFPVNTDKISATFDNGILEIKLPRAEEFKPKHIQLKEPVSAHETRSEESLDKVEPGDVCVECGEF